MFANLASGALLKTRLFVFREHLSQSCVKFNVADIFYKTLWNLRNFFRGSP